MRRVATTYTKVRLESGAMFRQVKLLSTGFFCLGSAGIFDPCDPSGPSLTGRRRKWSGKLVLWPLTTGMALITGKQSTASLELLIIIFLL